MKKIIFFLLISTAAFAQNVDYNKIILPPGAQTDDFAEKLVQIAWKNHPTNEIFRRQVNIADIEVKKNKVQWLDLVRVSSNLNEFVLNPGNDVLSRSAFYPKYNVSGSISIGTFFIIPYNTKQSKEQLMISQSQVNAQKLQVRNSVMRAYNNYVLREKIYRIQSQIALDNETSHKLLEQKFKNGEITFETYSASLGAFSQVTLNHLSAERDFKDAKLDLEQLIGMKLEDVR